MSDVDAAAPGKPTQLDFGVWVILNPLGDIVAAIYVEGATSPGESTEHWAFEPGSLKRYRNDIHQQYILRAPKVTSANKLEKDLAAASTFATFQTAINKHRGANTDKLTDGWLYIPAACPSAVDFPSD